MSGQDYEQLTLFLEDSRVSHFPWLESKKEKGTTVIYGRKCSELSETLRRVGLSVKTYLESCELPLPTLYRTWSVKAMTSSCLILKLRLSERRTDGSVSRLWPTPDTQNGRNGNKMRKEARGRHAVSLHHAAAMWQTPTTGAGLCGGTGHFQQLHKLKDAGIITEERKNLSQGNGGQLNPTWVEWLMGFPLGWTDLNA